MPEPVVLYEERGSVAIVTLNRPEKMNALTEGVVQGIADAIDRATASRPVRSIVLRGAGRTLTGGYDLNPGAGEIEERIEAHARRFEHIPANQLALNKLLINQAFENMGLRTSQLLGTFFDGVTRHTEEAHHWVESFAEKGFREVIRERDAPHGDYGERPRADGGGDPSEDGGA